MGLYPTIERVKADITIHVLPRWASLLTVRRTTIGTTNIEAYKYVWTAPVEFPAGVYRTINESIITKAELRRLAKHNYMVGEPRRY